MKKKTTEEFIAEAKRIHGNKYDYSQTVYVDCRTPVTIICPKHGPFTMAPNNHTKQKQGCPKCYRRFSNTEEFIEYSKTVHGDKYDYSQTVYNKSTERVCIICPEHGPFHQTPREHASGCGCPKCSFPNKSMTFEEFVEKANIVHKGKYDYSKTIFRGIDKHIIVSCPLHGDFETIPRNHLEGRECPICARITAASTKRMTVDEFIERAKRVHGDRYDYSKCVYSGYDEVIEIVCPEHGPFWQTPHDHLDGHGCPNCCGLRKSYKFNLLSEFEDEYALRAFLSNNDINILFAVLRNIEPKFEPIKNDIEFALRHATEEDPIQYLVQKYSTESENEPEQETTHTETTNTIDLDNDDNVYTAINAAVSDGNEDETELTIEDVIRNDEQEIQVINRVEHMLTPEVRKQIMKKFLNDKRRFWIYQKEKFGK